MPTEPTAPAGEAGFTLIEVLAAMLILAFGLLSLEALGIGAARSVAMADRQSEFASLAASSLEDALEQLGAGVVPEELCEETRFGALLSREVDLSDANRPHVVVRVLPDPSVSGSPREPFEVRSSIFSPTPIAGAADGTPCP